MMSRSRLAVLSMVLVATVGRAESPRSHGVRLSARDRGEISRIACARLSLPEATRIDGSTERRGSSLIRVTVRCGSHRNEGSVPVAHLASCSNARAKWSCDAGHEVLTMAMPEKQPLIVAPDGISMATAASVMADTITLTIPPFYKPLAPLLMPECVLRQDQNPPFKGAVLFRLACTNWDVEVTRDCGVRPCRHFVVRADPKTASRQP